MQELWDAEGVRELLCEICAGTVKVREIYTETASPMSLPLQWAQEAAVMYDYAPTPRGIHNAVEDMLKEAVKPGESGVITASGVSFTQGKTAKRCAPASCTADDRRRSGSRRAGGTCGMAGQSGTEWQGVLSRAGGCGLPQRRQKNILRRLAQHFWLIIPQNVQQSPVKLQLRLSGECCATEAPPTLPRLPAVMDCRSLLQRLS